MRTLSFLFFGSLSLLLVAGCGGATANLGGAGEKPAASGSMTVSESAPTGANLLKNGNFDEGVITPWVPVFSQPGRGTSTLTDGKLCLRIESGGSRPFDVLLRQRPVPLRRHHEYVLRLRARASVPTQIRPALNVVGSPPTELWSAVVDVTPTETQYEARLKPSEAMDGEAELVIHLGGALTGAVPVDLCLDDLFLEEPGVGNPQSEEQTRPKVRVNQVGYLPSFPKLAVVKSTSATPLEFSLLDASGKVVMTGKTKPYGEDKDAGELIHQIDFSSFKQSGRGFVLAVGADKSDPFVIDAGIYAPLKRDAFQFFYHQRSGTAIEMPYAKHEQWARPAAHLSDQKIACAPGSGCSYSLDGSGGWYDAGDHGKYVVNGGIAVHTLLNWYERTQLLGSSLGDFADGKLDIPERANKQPDFLDEVRWELDWMMRMQVPEGQPLAGMAHHKMHSDKWTGIPTAPHEDTQIRHLKRPSTAATLNLAAVAAQCARIYQKVDGAFSARCLKSAERAFAAAEKNPKLFAPGDDKEGGGPYGDIDVADEFYWAAAELFITTGAAKYKSVLTKSPHYLKLPVQAGGGMSSMSWQNVAGLGTISLSLVPNQLGKAEIATARKAIEAAAQKYLAAVKRSGYMLPYEAVTYVKSGDAASAIAGRYPWGSNSFVLNNGVIMALAYDFTGNSAYLAGAEAAAGYILGRNPMAQSYVTGYGARPLMNPHHRFWARQADAKFPPPPAGIVSGGPNSGIEDPEAQAAGLGGCAPQKCFLDHIQSWSTNEIAINWNAPFFWLVAFLDEKAGKF